VKGESSHHRKNEHVVRRRSRDDQEMVKGVASKGERSHQFGQCAVDLQGLADRGRALVADLVPTEAATTGQRAHGQEMVKGWSRGGQGSGIKKRALTPKRSARR
jgi:hypothetical protein